MDKAYYTYKDKQAKVTLSIPDNIYLDQECFKNVSVPYISEDDGMFLIKLKNEDGNTAHLPKDSTHLIHNSHSIESVELGLNANKNSERITDMISYNNRLDYINLGITSTKLKHCGSLITDSNKLKEAYIQIEADNLERLEAIVKGTPQLNSADIDIRSKSITSLSNLVDAQPKLEKIKINLNNKTKNLKEMEDIFTRCPELREVKYIGTTDSETGADFIRKEYKVDTREWTYTQIHNDDKSRYHKTNEYTNIDFYKDDDTFEERNKPADSDDED